MDIRTLSEDLQYAVFYGVLQLKNYQILKCKDKILVTFRFVLKGCQHLCTFWILCGGM